VDEFYWERDPGAPFGLLIRIATACLHPEADQLGELQLRARRPGDEEMRAFKAQLRAAVSDPGRVPGDELSRHVEYKDGSPGAFLRRLWRDLYGDEPPGMGDGLFAPDPELRELDTGELLAMVSSARVSVLRRGRALLELGRRATGDTALLEEVAVMVRDPGNRRLITVGAVSVSQLGTAGLLAGGGRPPAALAWELAAEWPAGERSDFEWLMTSCGIAWPHDL
jgi:hypothetical protein